jgi:hypothetical protein
MDRFDYQEMINDLLDKASGELSDTEFEILLSRVKDIINDYE